jgi:GNAT superfamily N-acetyltransferase
MIRNKKTRHESLDVSFFAFFKKGGKRMEKNICNKFGEICIELDSTIAYISYIFAFKQGLGHGRKLLLEAIAYCKTSGVDRIYLHAYPWEFEDGSTKISMIDLIHFYEKNGFTNQGKNEANEYYFDMEL